MLKLKLHYSGHLMWRTDLLEKTLILGKFRGRRRKGWQRMRWLDGITSWLYGYEFEQVLGVGDVQGSLACCSPWGHRVRHDWATELNWTLSLLSPLLCIDLLLYYLHHPTDLVCCFHFLKICLSSWCSDWWFLLFCFPDHFFVLHYLVSYALLFGLFLSWQLN